MSMGTYIKELRLQKKMSQEELGKIVGVNRAAVNKWESGQVENIKRSVILKLSDFFGVSPVELMQFDNDSEKHAEFSHEEEEIIKAYRQLPDESKKLVTAFMKIGSSRTKKDHPQKSNNHSDKPDEPGPVHRSIIYQ